MNYWSRYGLEYNPFIKNANEVLVKTNAYNEVTTRLNYLATNKGYGLITGGAGKGKTTTIRNWIKGLHTAQYKVVYISLSTVTVQDFYRQLAHALGGEVKHRKIDNFKTIQECITRYVLEKRITPVLIFDEANHISSSILNDFKMLFNFEIDARDRSVVLLVGSPQIHSLLRLNAHESLRQRITMNYQMEGLSKQEVKEYIEEKMKGADCHHEVFDATAIEAISNASNGIARIINSLCNNCLMIAHHKGVTSIDSDIVLSAVNEYEVG